MDCFFDSITVPLDAHAEDGMCVVTAVPAITMVWTKVWSEYLTTICEQAG